MHHPLRTTAVLLTALAACPIAAAIRVQSGAHRSFPYCSCAGSSTGPLQTLPRWWLDEAGRLCFTVFAGYNTVETPVPCTGACCRQPMLTKIEISVNAGCSAHNTQVTATADSAPLLHPGPAFDLPPSGPTNATILRLTGLRLTPGVGGTDFCLSLGAVKGRPGACDSPASLCAPVPGAPPGSCALAVWGSEGGCCSLLPALQPGDGSKPVPDKNPKFPPGSRPPYVVGESSGSPPWFANYFPDIEAQWIWSSPDAAVTAPTNRITYFYSYIAVVQRPLRTILHLVADDACDVYWNGRWNASVVRGGMGQPDLGSTYNYITKLPLEMQVGLNLLVLRCVNAWTRDGTQEAESGVIATVTPVSDGQGELPPWVHTDRYWYFTTTTALLDDFPGPDTPVEVLGPPGMEPWGSVHFPDQNASWIGIPNGLEYRTSADVGTIRTIVLYEVSLTLPAAGDAVLHLQADNVADVFLNGGYVGSVVNGFESAGYAPGEHAQMRLRLRAGANTLQLRATNEWSPGGDNPTGVLASLFEDPPRAPGGRGGKPRRPPRVLLRSDASWTYRVNTPIPPIIIY
ncbi:hypothetical protein HYH03_009849 [Edaphochlamys debaryana]|uniref:Pherophorin domain-containing protein n=1 Tax=Edaphochlamys debaryana TaxID=47281 RepID=A0A835XVH2_9CHLO|nr:hypothetical protein HYH03_009849 [Edaphochlamys debaryana]|eukprot:KAG2491897.1 hypothetical protein HYH03_009849 [Edaphochlamys debaryana]